MHSMNERAVEKNPKIFVFLFLCFGFPLRASVFGSHSRVKITEACVLMGARVRVHVNGLNECVNNAVSFSVQ